MNKVNYFALALMLATGNNSVFAQKISEKSAINVLKRVSGQKELPIDVKLKKNQADDTYFKYHIKNGKLKVEASSPVALCRGVYDFAKKQELGINSWSGTNLNFPSSLSNSEPVETISPFKHHYYFNVVTYGYSMPYWDWNRWEREIDWMAMHGIDMPLALIAYEAIIARVWQNIGLTNDEINNYFVGPAHLPWMRMGNISGIDGPLNEDWYNQQVDLQHKVLKRMRELGMKPICPGFPGFVPPAIKRVFPNLHIFETHWGGAFKNWMISPEEELFSMIGTAFIKEWEKEFGTCEHYLVDSFNEMEVPFPAKGTKERVDLVASYGEKVYNSIKNGNPNAVWTMQGWMFGYQRYIWDYETLEALVSKVPNDKMLLLDLAVDYNVHFWHSQVNWDFYKGFYNKPWVYSLIPNMGGKTGPTGVLEFYANGHLNALNSINKGNLVAHGFAPEGIENNEVIYELLTDAGWSKDSIDLKLWLHNYAKNRYGKDSAPLDDYWDGMLKSVYGSFTDHPRFNWQFRPGLSRNGSINTNTEFYGAVESFVATVDSTINQLQQIDLAELMAFYLGGKAEILTKVIDQDYLLGDTIGALAHQTQFEEALLGIDKLLSIHPSLRLSSWLDMAKMKASNEYQEKQFVSNAKRIVTIWGPPVDDYSARIWNGLVADYYLPRWKKYFESRQTGNSFDFSVWEKSWVEDVTIKPSVPEANIVALALHLMRQFKGVTNDMRQQTALNRLGNWSANKKQPKEIVLQLSAKQLKELKKLRVVVANGQSTTLTAIKIIADGNLLFEQLFDGTVIENKGAFDIGVSIPTNANANNGCQLVLTLSSENASGYILDVCNK